MWRLKSSLLRLLITVMCAYPAAVFTPANADQPLKYPPTRTVDQVDELHGVRVADPYRWLEDLDSPETAAWVAAQNELTFSYLEQIPAREKIRQRLTHLWNFERYGIPFTEGGRYFYTRNDGLQNQSVLYVAESLDGPPRVLVDPNLLSADGTIALTETAPSHDGRLLVYGLSTAGSDWEEYRVRDVDSGADLPDQLRWIKFSNASWTHDNRGFFYSRYDEPEGGRLTATNYYQKLYYHRLGTDQSDDRLVCHRPDEKEWGFNGQVTDDGQYLVITVWKGTSDRNQIFYLDLAAPDAAVTELITGFDAQYVFVDNDGAIFWFFTNLDAPRGRLVAVDIRQPQRDRWKTVIPEAEETLQSVTAINNQFIAVYLQDAHTVVRVYDLAGNYLRNIKLPGIGTARGFGGKRSDRESFYSFTSFSTPGTVYRYDAVTGQSVVYRQPRVDFNPEDYATRQIFYRSRDGTRVPMFITHRRGLALTGDNPTYLYGYGGFNASITPHFSVSRLVWMEMGGVYAVPNLRGGGEYGKQWHDAGRLKNKQNVFEDFIAAAEWLIENRYTNSRRLAIAGASNGGLLVGACITQRPELFGAALPAVGVMDMLRFHRYTIGWAWVSDYGSPDDPEMFPILYAYSPLHNIRPGTCYPATLITTADHDDRVVPAHSFKFAAALQAAQACDNPVLIRIETRAGHGAGKPTAKLIAEAADQLAFLVRVLNMDLAGWAPQKPTTQPQ
jgi:prolyl oligopeptidase